MTIAEDIFDSSLNVHSEVQKEKSELSESNW